jgi:hypothetical protein
MYQPWTLKFFLEHRIGLKEEPEPSDFLKQLWARGQAGEIKVLAELMENKPQDLGLAETGTFEKVDSGNLYGASPDAVVWCGQLFLPVEVKTHVNMAEVPYEMKTLHWVQLQFQMWTMGAKYGLWCGYCPNAENDEAEPPATHRRMTLYKYCESVIKWILRQCNILGDCQMEMGECLSNPYIDQDARIKDVQSVINKYLKDSRVAVEKLDWSMVRKSRVKTVNMDRFSLAPFANQLRMLDASESAPFTRTY